VVHPLVQPDVAFDGDDAEQSAALDRRALARYGLKRRLDEPGQIRALLRMGLRVDATESASDGRTWVHLSGRNPDRSRYRFSTLWRRSHGAWLQVPTSSADEAGLARGAPAPLEASPLRALPLVTARAELVADAIARRGADGGLDIACEELGQRAPNFPTSGGGSGGPNRPAAPSRG
jgi:hypothetical protein